MAKKKKNEDEYVELFDQIIPEQDILIILQPLCSDFEFEEELENDIYFLDNKELYDYEKIENKPAEHQTELFREMKKFKESKLPIMCMYYLPPLALGLFILVALWKKMKVKHNVECIAFFHNDEEMKKVKIPREKNKVKFRDMIIEEIEEFDFIKRFNIPADFKINRDYLNKLLKEMV